jgi:hypothetical protein
MYAYSFQFTLLLERFSPWQIIVSTLTAVYAARNLDKITGFGGKSRERYHQLIHLIRAWNIAAPEPLARLVSPCPLLVFDSAITIGIQYSPSYYRATWIAIGLDAGFATAASIRPKWLKDFCSILFSIYYIIYANEADEKVLLVHATNINTIHRNMSVDPQVQSCSDCRDAQDYVGEDY